MSIELRDIDVNEPAETPAPSAETPAKSEEEPKETQLESPEHAEEPAKEPVAEPTKVQEESQEPKPQEPEKPKRSRAEGRIRDLAYENKILKDKVEQFTQQKAPELQKEEIAYDDLNRIINERAMQAAELIVASQQVGTKLQNQAQVWADDLDQVRKDNPQLNPQSPEYDADLDATLAKLLDDGTGMPRTDVLVSDVIKQFKKRETATQQKAIEEGKSQANAKLAKQMAEGAITPNAKSPSKTDEDLSDEESAELRTKNPKEWLKRL